MDVETITGPATEPLTLAEAKAHLRVDHADEDAQITALISEARQQVEAFTRLRLVTQTVRATAHGFGGLLALPVWPVQSVSEVAYDDAGGVSRVLAADQWTLVKSAPRRLAPAYGLTWPTVRDHWNAVRVTVFCGFGDADAVPADLKAAMKLIVGSLYTSRNSEIIGTIVQEQPALSAARAKMTPHIFYPGG